MNKTNVIEILKRRGLLINTDKKGCYLSSLSLKEERDYLKDILSKYKLGKMNRNRITLDCEFSYCLYNDLFEKNNGCGYEAINVKEDINNLYDGVIVDRYPASLIEAYIASYVVALNMIGIHTWCSCDGNHIDIDNPKIQVLIKEIYIPIHQILWEELLSHMFSLNWTLDYQEISLEESKYEIYESLYQSANYILDNKNKIKKAFNGAILKAKKDFDIDETLLHKEFRKEISKLKD